MRFSALFLFSACLAQSIAFSQVLDHNNGVLEERDQGSYGNGNGNGNGWNNRNQNQSTRNCTESDGDGHRSKDQNDSNFNNSAVTVTVTETQQAKAPLTVLTVTVTQFQPCASGVAGVGPSGSGIISPPAPPSLSAVSTTVLTVPTDSAGTARKFITNGDVQVGLTSIPVAVASSLGSDATMVVPSPGIPSMETASTSTSAMVSPGSFVTASVSQPYSLLGDTGTTTAFFAGTTLVTSASIAPGLSSIPVADSRKSVT